MTSSTDPQPEPARCCDDPSCRRKQPILIRRDPFTNRWVAITRWRRSSTEAAPDRIYAIEKHEIVIDLDQ